MKGWAKCREKYLTLNFKSDKYQQLCQIDVSITCSYTVNGLTKPEARIVKLSVSNPVTVRLGTVIACNHHWSPAFQF